MFCFFLKEMEGEWREGKLWLGYIVKEKNLFSIKTRTEKGERKGKKILENTHDKETADIQGENKYPIQQMKKCQQCRKTR